MSPVGVGLGRFSQWQRAAFPVAAEKICKDIRHTPSSHLWAKLGLACVCRVQHRPQGVTGHGKAGAERKAKGSTWTSRFASSARRHSGR